MTVAAGPFEKVVASEIINRAALALNDTDNIRWGRPELLKHLSDAQRAAVLIKPEVNPVTVCIQTVPGSRQVLPDDGWVLFEVVRNMGSDGATPGRSISPSQRSDLDSFNDWHVPGPYPTTGTAEAQARSLEIRNFVYEVKNRKAFYIYPAQPTHPSGLTDQQQIEIIYSAIPQELAADTDDIGIDDPYQPALLAYILHRAHIKDIAAEGQSEQKSSIYFQQFMALLGAADEQGKITRIEKTESNVYQNTNRR